MNTKELITALEDLSSRKIDGAAEVMRKAIAKAEKLPLNLLDALRAFDKDKSFKEGLGKAFSDSFIKLKMEEWHSYTAHFSEWEKRIEKEMEKRN